MKAHAFIPWWLIRNAVSARRRGRNGTLAFPSCLLLELLDVALNMTILAPTWPYGLLLPKLTGESIEKDDLVFQAYIF